MVYDGPHFASGSCVANRGCIRPECRNARWRTIKQQKYDKAHGRSWTVDPARAQERLAFLRAAGMETKAIARAAHVSPKTLEEIEKQIRPKIYRRVETAILTVLPVPGGRALIDATVTYRQLRALYALGYSHRYLYTTGHFGPEIRPGRPRPRLPAGVVQRIADLAAAIGDTPGPSRICRQRAAAKGWLVPAWYDEDWQPSSLLGGDEATGDAAPCGATERREAIRRLVLDLHSCNETARTISARITADYGRFGTSERAVHRILAAARQDQEATG